MAECPRPLKVCTATTTLAEATTPSCDDWEICLPWGARLWKEGDCVKYEAGTPPADGVYGTFTLENGCFVSAEPPETPKYQGSPCASVPCPCDSSDEGDSNLCNPSSTSGNLYTCDALGKPLVKAYVSAGNDNVTVTGNGTSTNPFKISANIDTGVTAIYTETGSVLEVKKSGSEYTINHAKGYNDQTINGMVFDSYGHLTNYTAQDAKGVQGVVAQGGITATTDNSSGIVTIQLADPTYPSQGAYVCGGYTVTLDAKNNIYQIARTIDITEGSAVMGSKLVSYNEYGSIVSVEELNTTGTWIHTLLPVPDSGDSLVVRRNVEFALYHNCPIMVELIVKCDSPSWVDGLAVIVDDSTVGDVAAYLAKEGATSTSSSTGSETSAVVAHVRAFPNGIYSMGTHKLALTNASGWGDYPVSLSIVPIQAVNSVEDSTSMSR